MRALDGKLQLENIGLNSCIVGDEEVLGGQSAEFVPGTKVRIWPFTLTFEAEKAVAVSRGDLKPTSARSWPTSSCGIPPHAAGAARLVPIRGQPRQRSG